MSRKAKTHKGTAKRFVRTGSGRIKHKHANRSHLRTRMTAKRIRQLRGTDQANPAETPRLVRLLEDR
ncbi:MAG: 50S ribosomal protein L35 [Gammaproteobacteria bacterium AqS3]|nr:50S ribosomal protein L35 [Gammaproteobacteria bacterium AqS3]